MPAKPPPLPEAVYRRVMLVAKIDGYSILLIAGMGAFMAASVGSVIPAIVACLIAGTGAMEIHGSQQLARGNASAVNWLVSAQLLLMLIILAYVVYEIIHFDVASVSAQISKLRRPIDEFYGDQNPFNPYYAFTNAQLVFMVLIAYYILGVVTCVYSSFMARYYHKRRAAIAQALAAEA